MYTVLPVLRASNGADLVVAVREQSIQVTSYHRSGAVQPQRPGGGGTLEQAGSADVEPERCAVDEVEDLGHHVQGTLAGVIGAARAATVLQGIGTVDRRVVVPGGNRALDARNLDRSLVQRWRLSTRSSR